MNTPVAETAHSTFAKVFAGSTSLTESKKSPVVTPGSLHRFELDNGLSVIVLEDHRLPRVSLGIGLRRGAASVERDRAGLASFTAELMKRGAGDRDSLELASAIDALGSVLSVRANWDSITAQIWGLTRDLDSMLGILADVVLRPRFDDDEAVRARGEQLAALERATDDPHSLERRFASAAMSASIFGSTTSRFHTSMPRCK